MATTISKTFLVKSTQDFSIPSSSFGLLTGSLAQQQQLLQIPISEQHTSGSFSSRPLGPGPGNTHFVNTGSTGLNTSYQCFVSGTWTQLAPVNVVYPLTSSVGWTSGSSGSGVTGIISGSVFTATVASGSITAYAASYVQNTQVFSPRWLLQGCVQMTSDTNGEFLAGLSGVWSGGLLTAYVRGTGGLYFYQEGSWGFASLTISGETIPLDGTGWVRLEVDGATVRFWTGIGSGSTPPSSWKLRAQNTWSLAINNAQPVSLRLTASQGTSHTVPSGTTVVWRDVSLTTFY